MQTSFSKAQAEHKQLLFNVKTTVEHLLLNNKTTSTRLDDVSFMHNADEVSLLHSAVEQIFIHGIRLFKADQAPDLWPFIEGLNWLNPAMTISVGNQSFTTDSIVTAQRPKPPSRIKSDKALVWIFDNLVSNKLIYKLQYLVSDTEHLNSCFEVYAFLQSSKYLNAFLLCLRAMENNQLNLLSQIEANLLPGKSDASNMLPPSHKRSTSHPNFSFIPGASSQSVPKKTSKPIRQQSQPNPKQVQPLRAWKSLPNLQVEQVSPRTRSKTISQPIRVGKSQDNTRFVRNQKVPPFSYQVLKPIVDQSEPDTSDLQLIQIIKCDDIKIHEHSPAIPTRHSSDSVECGSEATSFAASGLFSFMPTWSIGEKSEATSPASYLNLLTAPAPADFFNAFVPKEGEKLISRSTVGSVGSISPIFNPYVDTEFNKTTTTGDESPCSVQSLTSFLQTGRFSRANNDLERENAHFSISEAMISTIEQIKCKITIDGQTDDKPPVRRRFADQVLNRARRHPIPDDVNKEFRMASKSGRDTNDKYRRSVMYVSSSSSGSSSMASSCSPPTPNRSYQPSPGVSRERQPMSSATSTNDNDTSTQSINAECQAYAEWGGNAIENWSAESVALSLISKFSDKQMPRSCDLLWLVSEQDTKQELLPMPGSWAVNPDEPYKVPFTRGTRDWAPPRAQVIFTRHEKIDRKSLLLKQNQRCAGCGMKVAAAYSHSFRYCEYLGRYHCTNCHRNQISVIPARVLDRWDFATFPVSVFSYRLLEEIWTVPLFRVSDLNAQLYGRVKALQTARHRRAQLKFVRDFVVSCRFAQEDGTKAIFEKVAKHIVNDVDLWSMADFTAVRLGSFIKDITALSNGCEAHIFSCELCKARGFICERCPRKQVIFPWQSKVRRCPECGVCVHESCWKDECAKCDRLRRREQTTSSVIRLATNLPTSSLPTSRPIGLRTPANTH